VPTSGVIARAATQAGGAANQGTEREGREAPILLPMPGEWGTVSGQVERRLGNRGRSMARWLGETRSET
jgi:hypothetical protein